MACPINKIVNVLKQDKILGKDIDVLIEATTKRENVEKEINKLLNQPMTIASLDVIADLRGQKNKINSKIYYRTKKLTTAKFVLPVYETIEPTTKEVDQATFDRELEHLINTDSIYEKISKRRRDVSKEDDTLFLKLTKELISRNRELSDKLSKSMYVKKVETETEVTEETKPHTAQTRLDASYIHNQSDKVQGKLEGVKLVRDIVKVVKEIRNKLQDTSLVDIINNAEGTNKEILNIILNKSANFTETVYNTTNTFNSTYTVKESPMMQLLYRISDKTGKIIPDRVMPMIMHITAISGYVDNLDMLKKNKTKEDVARTLGYDDKSEVDAETYALFRSKGTFMRDLADSLGRQALKEAGYKQAKNTTPEEYGRLAAEIGSAIVMMMQEEGLVEIHELSIKDVNDAINNSDKVSNEEANVKMVSAIAVGKDITTVAIEQRRILTAVEEELDMDLSLDTNIPKTEPLPVEKKLKIHHSDTNAEGPKKMLSVKNKLQKQEWTIDDNANELLATMDEDIKLKYMGYVDPLEVDGEYVNSSYDRQIEIDGQNENIESSLNALDPDSVKPTGYVLEDYYNGAKGRASIYFEYFVSKNFRYFIKSSGLNPQTDKLHRFIVHGMKAIATYNRNNNSDMYAFKYAVAQGFGYKVDGKGKTRNSITTEFQRLADRTYKVIKKEFDEGNANIKAGELGHYINAMGALKAYEDSIANNSNTFESNALAEIDHKTNGFAHKLMQYPVLPTKLMKLSLNQVGVWTELTNDDTTKVGGLDPYQSNALGFTQSLVKTALDNHKVPKGVKTFITKLDENNLLTFVKDGDVTPELRNIMKPLFMIFNYSAGIKSIKRTLAYTLSSKMLNKIVLDPENENNRTFLEILSEARVNKDTTIEHQIKTIAPQNIKIKVDGLELSLFEYLSKSYDAIYGDSLEKSFAKYDAIKNINSISNVAFRGMFEVFIVHFEDFLKSNPTQPEIDTWLTEKKHLIPHVVTSHGDNTPLHIVDVLKKAATDYFTNTKFKRATKVADGKFQTHLKSNPTIKAFKAAVSSGSVLPIHSIDGDNMTRVLDENPGVLGVHDADVTGAKGLKKVAKSANKHFYEIHKEYSIMQEVLKAFKLIQAEATKDISIKVSKDVAKLFDVEDKILNLAQIAATLEKTAKEVEKARERLFTGDMTVENMIYNNSGAHKVAASSETELGSKISDLTEDQQEELADELFLLDQNEKNKIISGEVEITDLMPSILGGFGSVRKRYTVIKATVNDAFAITVKIQDRDTGKRYTYGFSEHSEVSAGKAKKFRLDKPLLTDAIRDRQYVAEETGRIASSDNTNNMDADDKLFDDLSTNTEAILDMVDTLNEQTGNATDQSVIDNLKEVLSLFDTEFLNATAVYFKDLANNKESSGSFDYKKNEVNLYLSQKKNRQYDHMQLPVIYAHEMLHALTYFAMKSNDVKAKALMRRLTYVYNAAEKVLTIEDFTNDSNPNQADAVAKAERDLGYVFGNNKKQGLAEFIAYGLTLPKVVKKLKASKLRENKETKGMWETLFKYVKALFTLVLGGAKLKDYSEDMFENLQNLSVALSVHNNRAINKIEKEPSGIKTFLDFTNDQLVSLIAMLKGNFKKDTDMLPTLPEDAGRVERIIWLGKLFPTLLMDNKHRGTLVMMLDFMYLSPTGMLQNIIRNVLTPEDTDLEREVEKLKLLSDEVDKIKKDLSESVAKGISTAFNDKKYLSKQEDSDLLDIVVDLDLPSLLEEFDVKDVAKILENGNYRRTLIAKYEAKIKAEARESRWVVNQARMLGYYMVHGVIDEAYNLNAHNIVKGRLLTDKARAVANPNLEPTIDKLATLYGIEYSDKETVLRTAELAKNTTGITTLMNTLTTIKEQSLKQNFSNDKTKMIKGYSVEVSPSTLDVLIRPIGEKKALGHDGYELRFEMPENDVTSTEPMGVFVLEDNTTSKYTRGATLLGNEVAKGTKLANILNSTDSFTSSNFALAKAKAYRRLRLSRKNAVEEDVYPEQLLKNRIGNSLTPVFSNSGKIKDFRYLMSKQNKKEILQLNRRASKVTGITFAGISNKVNRADNNKNIMELISKDMKENYEGDSIGKNLYPYVEVGKYAESIEGKEIYDVLPYAFRKFIDGHPTKKIAVRSDMLHEYFGYRNIDLLNTEVAKNIPRPILKQLKLGNKIWEGIVDIYSTDITIRTPDVVLSNTTSNVAYLMQLGYDPIEVVKDFKEFTPIVYAHVDAHKALLELQIKVQIKTATLADKRKIKRLEEQIASNPAIEEVMEEGLLGNIVEEVVAAGDNDEGGNIVKDFVREKVDKLPEVMQVGLDNMYVTKNTEAYKNIERAVQMGDFIARVVLNNNLRKEGIPQKERMIRLRDAFVNYSKLYAPLEEYGNRMGAFKFTKYAKGSQRSFGVLANEKPLYALMSLVAQELLFEFDEVLDQNMLTRSYRSMKFNPVDILTTVATPDVLRPFS